MVLSAEYIWLDVNGNTRSKTKLVTDVQLEQLFNPKSYSIWNYDGSSTGQATGTHSEVLVRPVKVVKDPFRGHDNVLVLCDTLLPDGSPHPSNIRNKCEELFSKVNDCDAMFGFEQEFFIVNSHGQPISSSKFFSSSLLITTGTPPA